MSARPEVIDAFDGAIWIRGSRHVVPAYRASNPARPNSLPRAQSRSLRSPQRSPTRSMTWSTQPNRRRPLGYVIHVDVPDGAVAWSRKCEH